MSENPKSCDWSRLRLDRITTDRYILAGRRGTGKSTGAKLAAAEDGARVIWCVRTKTLARGIAGRFVAPAVRHVLPQPEPIDSDPDMPLFTFGRGAVQVVPLTMITALRDTGISVDSHQEDAIILDECFPPDARYKRDEPQLLDDLAATVGRSGVIPPVICIGNPVSNKNPYSYTWRVNVLSEGIYTHDSISTEVKGTADCCDCFGRRIGVDAGQTLYAAHLDNGGDVVTVNGRGLRVRSIRSWLYVGLADPTGTVLMRRGSYTPESLTSAGTRFLLECKQALYSDRCIFDSFEAEMIFYELTRARE